MRRIIVEYPFINIQIMRTNKRWQKNWKCGRSQGILYICHTKCVQLQNVNFLQGPCKMSTFSNLIQFDCKMSTFIKFSQNVHINQRHFATCWHIAMHENEEISGRKWTPHNCFLTKPWGIFGLHCGQIILFQFDII